jgi:3-carboxy-cis,cis-muconate cycloisomerase
MRPSSSGSDPGLFDGVLARGAVRDEVGDGAFVAAMLEVESALARAAAEAGLVPAEAAEAIATACRAVRVDLLRLAEQAPASGNPVVPLVAALREALPAEAAGYVHKGATSQDILDSAAMLVARRALVPLLADLHGAADAAAGLARAHRDTPMAGRTLLQQAVPTTFGLKAAGWTIALDEVATRLDSVRRDRLAAQLGGAAGTLGALAPAGPVVLGRMAHLLGLAEPILPWHTDRTRPAELATALGTAAGVIGKVARDITLLAQNEVGEVAEGAPGGSSAMAHKRNPVAAVSAYACAAQAPGLVATLLAAMPHEHERAAGAWHAEWRPLPQLLVSVGSAAAWLRDCLGHLVVDPAAMRGNLDALLVVLGEAEPDVGAAGELVDRSLAAHAEAVVARGRP